MPRIRDEKDVIIANPVAGEIIYKPSTGYHIIVEYLENWFDFANNYHKIDTLTKVAILHSQFGVIHPFVDGNRRTGRILIIFGLQKIFTVSLPVYQRLYYQKKNLPLLGSSRESKFEQTFGDCKIFDSGN